METKIIDPPNDSPDPGAVFSGDDDTVITFEFEVTATGCLFGPGTQSYKPKRSTHLTKKEIAYYYGGGDYILVMGSLFSLPVTRKLTIVKPDLVMQSLSEEDDPTPNEEDPGAVVCLNDDDDNMNEMPDSDDDDLVELTLYAGVGKLVNGTLTLDAGPKLKVWEKCDRTAAAPMTWTLPDASLDSPKTYFVEGIDASSMQGDISLELRYAGPVNVDDKVKVSVVKVDFIAKAAKAADPAETEVMEEKEEKDGLVVCTNDDDDDGDSASDNADEAVTGNPGQKALDREDLATLLLKQIKPSDLAAGKVFIKKLEGMGEIRLFKKSDDSLILTTSGSTSATTDAQADALFTVLKAGDETYMLEGVKPGELVLAIEYKNEDAGIECQDRLKITVLRIDLDVDADRDGIVKDKEDDTDEDKWDKNRGAIFAVNLDRDGSRSGAGGVLIPDAIHFDDTGAPVNEDFDIDNADDEKDIAELVIRKITDKLPMNLKVYLKADELEDVQRVHIFKKIKAGETAIWGAATGGAPLMELDITKWVDPDSPDFQGDSGTKDATFGIEGMFFRYQGASAVPGLEFDGEIDFTLELRDGMRVVCSDKVRLKVAPWIASTHAEASQEIWAEDAGASNDEYRNNAAADAGYKGLDDSGQLNTASGGAAGSQWFQDHLQFGFTQRPGGPKTHMVIRLPYGSNPTWPLEKLLKPDAGAFTLGSSFGVGSGDFGGNLEIVPPTAAHQLGRLCMGDSSSATLRQFLVSQEVQAPFFGLSVTWLIVAHIDEVTSFLGGGAVALADPTQAWDLISDVANIPAADRHRSIFFATGANPEGGEVGAGTSTRLYDGPATGEITTVGEANLVDGETFTIKQDAATGKTFEFNLAGGVTAGNIAIDLTGAGASSAAAVRDVIVAAVNGSGLTVSAIADGPALVHLWNTTKGVAGNQAITETVAHAGFTRTGMTGGKAGGRDFTAGPWNGVRTFSYAAGQPTGGQVAGIKAAGRHDGWVEIDFVWDTTSKIIAGGAAVGHAYAYSERPPRGLGEAPTSVTWHRRPVAGDKYAVVQGTRFWATGTPAIVSVEEVLADADFEALNKTDVQGELNAIRASMNAAGGGLSFVSLPNLFFGRRAGFAGGRRSVAFNPGPTNLQPLGGKRYVPRQFGPRTAAGTDLYESAIRTALGAGTEFVDCWDLYHRLLGEVHCGSEVKRDFPGVDWWTKIP